MTSRRDPERLAELRKLLILDTPSEANYEELTRRLATVLDVPMTMFNLLDEERDWFKAAFGTPLTESPLSSSFCEVFLQNDSAFLVVEDATRDLRFASHPLVVGAPHIRFYAAVRLTVRGHTIGTLCAYDYRPRSVTQAQLQEFQTLARSAIELALKDAPGRQRPRD